jgi:hypothetical protein
MIGRMHNHVDRAERKFAAFVVGPLWMDIDHVPRLKSNPHPRLHVLGRDRLIVEHSDVAVRFLSFDDYMLRIVRYRLMSGPR